MYGVPLPPQQAAPAGQTSQGVSSQAGHPQWGGQGYHNQYMQQRQQMQQQMAGMMRPNAPMPGAPPQPSGPGPQQQASRPPGMYSGGMIKHALAGGGQINLDLPRHEQDIALRHVIHGALRYAGGGATPAPSGMQTVAQAPPPTGNQPQGALAPHAAMASSPLGQNGTPSGLYTPQNFQPTIAATPNPSQMSDYQRTKGIFTADSTPQYLSNPAPGEQRTLINQLGPQGQAAGSPPTGQASASVSDQIAAILAGSQGHAEGGPIDYDKEARTQLMNSHVEQNSRSNPYPNTLDVRHWTALNEAEKNAETQTNKDMSGQPQGLGMAAGGDIDFTGGGQPIDYSAGRKRDTIPALLDHGEYVFTRNAVKGAGGGDIHAGGKILGALMRHYESQA